MKDSKGRDVYKRQGYERVAYASSDLSPEQKNEVYRRVREGEVDLFYLSPELLLAYDISYFVGERRIGLVVVDEAHTVTTWGKEFRVDYWFLGRHLEALKNALGYVFPVFALTATAVWNPKGGNDMIFDTIRSLHLAPCALYVGTVKRENIGFDITAMTIEEGETYDKAKQRTVAARVEDFLDGHKTIIYYPFAGGIDMKLKTWVYPANWHWVASYYGKKDKEQKAEIIQAFKEGEKKIIVATKAFGMGVDISDIDRVYHVAPSGTFVDYIQEIGRAARDKNISGVAATDFNERDFYYMKRLHSAGAISQEQLGMILKKVWEIYLMKGCSDEMQMSLSDFEFAVRLPRKKNKLEYESDLEQVIKTALLWIEEDLSFRHGGSPVEINSQTLFADGYVQEKTGDAANRWMNSSYHVIILGDLLTWYFRDFDGFNPAQPAYKQIIFKPDFSIQELSYVKASHNTLYGKMISNWKKTLTHLEWDITIPCNTTALVYLPTLDEKAVKDKDVTFVRREGNSTVWSVPSGNYHFSVSMDPSLGKNRVGIVEDQFLYEQASFPECHGATIVELKNGDLVASFFGGTKAVSYTHLGLSSYHCTL